MRDVIIKNEASAIDDFLVAFDLHHDILLYIQGWEWDFKLGK
jgi:hypothetical protein